MTFSCNKLVSEFNNSHGYLIDMIFKADHEDVTKQQDLYSIYEIDLSSQFNPHEDECSKASIALGEN